MNVFRRVINLYWRYFKSPICYAKHIGVTIGEDTEIYTRFWSSEPYLITIGKRVQVTDNVHFYTHGGGKILRRVHPDYDAFGKIVIEDDVYIGSCSLILPGVTIGEGSLVAAGSVVTKSVPPHVVVGGNPARVICSAEEFIARNERFNVKTKFLSNEEKKKVLKNLPNNMFTRK